MILRVLVIAAVLVIALLLILRFTRRYGRNRSALHTVVNAIGPARCLAAASLLTTLAREANQATIHHVWDAIELPLLQALPDCPPAAKPTLMNALDALAKVTTNRDLAKRIMTMRNGLLS